MQAVVGADQKLHPFKFPDRGSTQFSSKHKVASLSNSATEVAGNLPPNSKVQHIRILRHYCCHTTATVILQMTRVCPCGCTVRAVTLEACLTNELVPVTLRSLAPALSSAAGSRLRPRALKCSVPNQGPFESCRFCPLDNFQICPLNCHFRG